VVLPLVPSPAHQTRCLPSRATKSARWLVRKDRECWHGCLCRDWFETKPVQLRMQCSMKLNKRESARFATAARGCSIAIGPRAGENAASPGLNWCCGGSMPHASQIGTL
jgi:hypothetical protein